MTEFGLEFRAPGRPFGTAALVFHGFRQTAAVAQLKETFGEIRGAAERVANRAKTMVSELRQVGAQTGVIQEKTKNIAGNGGKVVKEMEANGQYAALLKRWDLPDPENPQ